MVLRRCKTNHPKTQRLQTATVVTSHIRELAGARPSGQFLHWPPWGPRRGPWAGGSRGWGCWASPRPGGPSSRGPRLLPLRLQTSETAKAEAAGLRQDTVRMSRMLRPVVSSIDVYSYQKTPFLEAFWGRLRPCHPRLTIVETPAPDPISSVPRHPSSATVPSLLAIP